MTIVNDETITGVDFNNALKSSAVIQGEATILTTTGIDMIPWLPVASWLMLLGLPALAIGLLKLKKATYNVRPFDVSCAVERAPARGTSSYAEARCYGLCRRKLIYPAH